MSLKCVMYLELIQHLGLKVGGGVDSYDKKNPVSRTWMKLLRTGPRSEVGRGPESRHQLVGDALYERNVSPMQPAPRGQGLHGSPLGVRGAQGTRQRSIVCTEGRRGGRGANLSSSDLAFRSGQRKALL